MKGGIYMSTIQKALVGSILKTYESREKVLQHFGESTEAKVERFVGMLNSISNVLR